MLRTLFLAFYIFLFELIIYQPVQIVLDRLVGETLPLFYYVYWGISILAILSIIVIAVIPLHKTKPRLNSIIRAFMMPVMISKVIILIPALLMWLIILLMETFGATTSTVDIFQSNFATSLILFGMGLMCLLWYGTIFNPHRYRVRKVTVPSSDLPAEMNGYKIVQISDLHAGSITRINQFEKAIDLINNEEADLVVFTGDLVNSFPSEMNDILENLLRIQSKNGVYSILGNHDYGDYIRFPSRDEKRLNFEEILAMHKNAGWKLLRNESVVLQENFVLIGSENISAKPSFKSYGKMDKAFLGAEDADFKVLLSHDPTHWKSEVVPKYKDIDLTLSGHTHGLQFGVEIPGIFKWSPSKFVYKEWAGLYQEGAQYLYVNRGLGTLWYPGRVGILPEITSITLKKV